VSEPVVVVPSHVPRTYLAWSVFAAMLCFLPLGLVAVYYGLRTSSAVTSGRDEEAAHDSRLARRWLIAALVVGIVIYLFLGAVFALLGAFSQ
jgi:hypothetical protein